MPIRLPRQRSRRPPVPGLNWHEGPISDKELSREDRHVLSWAELRRDHIDPARNGSVRLSTENPAQALLDLMHEQPRLAVTGVELRANGDLADLYGFVIEPAWRRGVDLLVQADWDLIDLDPALLIKPRFGCPYTHERLCWDLCDE